MRPYRKIVYDIGRPGNLFCKNAIENAGKLIVGIQSIEVDIRGRAVHVVYLPDRQRRPLHQLIKIIRKTGYEPILKTQAGAASNKPAEQ